MSCYSEYIDCLRLKIKDFRYDLLLLEYDMRQLVISPFFTDLEFNKLVVQSSDIERLILRLENEIIQIQFYDGKNIL